MRALVRHDRSLRLELNRPEPERVAGAVVVSPTRVLVSGWDRDVAAGTFGFEGVLGSSFVATTETGERVAVDPVTFCGTCDLCRGGLREHCRDRAVLGRSGCDGGLADRCLVPEANLLPIPDGVDDDRAVFALLVAAAAQTRRQLRIEGQPFITVLGDGPLGLITAQVLQPLNASVRIIGRYSEKLALAERWGIKHRHVDDIGRRADQDVVIDCTGSAGGFATALALVRPRGTILLKSNWSPGDAAASPIAGPVLVEKAVRVEGSSGGSFSEALTLLNHGEVDVLPLIGRRWRLDDGAPLIESLTVSGSLAAMVAIS